MGVPFYKPHPWPLPFRGDNGGRNRKAETSLHVWLSTCTSEARCCPGLYFSGVYAEGSATVCSFLSTLHPACPTRGSSPEDTQWRAV